MTKKISVVMATYNGERFLHQQIDSVLNQSYPLHEIIIQDDGSYDSTWSILEEYASKYPIIHIYRNELEHGVNRNFYSAMSRATGEFIAICDQDDIWEPQKIDEQVKLIGNNLLIEGTTIPFSEDGSPVYFDARPCNNHILHLLFVTMMPGHSMMLRPEILKHFRTANYQCYDIELQVVAATMESLKYQGICPVKHRCYVGTVSYTKPTNNSRRISNIINYILICIKVYPIARLEQIKQMNKWQILIESIDIDTPSKQLALKMSHVLQKCGILGKIHQCIFFYKHRTVLFHVVEKDCFLLKLRSLMFPLLSVYYYRGAKK